MISLGDHKILEKIYESSETLVYRAQDLQAKRSVILKILSQEYPTLEEITQLRHEYEISKYLNLPGVIQAYELKNYQNRLFLIMEDFGGLDLKKFTVTRQLKLIEFLNIAIQLVDSIGAIHEKQVIHKDIKPQNIIINPETQQIKITDFSIASRLARQNTTGSNPISLEGTLAYISPEQTGRMNRSIDYRSDFYSLGITFYEILTGQLPFQSDDPLELVHCHIAKQPIPPQEIKPAIPTAVSDIVMKLLAKTAEDRYQSTLGLKSDLEACLNQLQATGNIINFVPGQKDLFSQFLIPQKLYGREAEVATLMESFERVNSGAAEIMLVSGFSGIGKSSLVSEVHKPIVRQRGYFISGKFDQFRRNIPYSSLIQAFQELMGQILTESQERIGFWKEQLLAAFSSNGRIIIDVIPEVELIVGLQPEVPELGPTESQNRFNRVFQQFIQVFTKPEHPLVLFLDDLQWADSASLKLIQLLITEPESQYLLLIGAYRDNEVSPTHPLMLTLDEIQKSQATINNIVLAPLEINDAYQLVADTFRESHLKNEAAEDRLKQLTDLVFTKTQGNPFFFTQLLTSLYEEKLLKFDFNKGIWKWDIEQIQTFGITDYDVVELVARNIQKLPNETQQVLKFAACIGNEFDLDILAVVNEKNQSETAADLWKAIEAGLIVPLNESYKVPLSFDQQETGFLNLDKLELSYRFLHDRVQQAAYFLIPEDEKKQTHLKIGRLLLKNHQQSEIKENIFNLVNQFNVGADLITELSEKDELAQLNLVAGQKAKSATAYEPAARYLNIALNLLSENTWQNQYTLSFTIYLETAFAEYLNTNFERAISLAEIALQQANNLLDQVKVYELKLQFYMAQHQMLKAIDTGLQVLEMLGVFLSPVANQTDLVVTLPQLERLEEVAEMTDPHQLAAMRILVNLASISFMGKPEIYPQVILTQINLCIQHGHSALAASAYGQYGLILCAMVGDLDAGYHSGQLALQLLNKYNAKELKSKVYNLFNGFVRHWKEHAREAIAPFVEAIQSGLETGDLEFVGYCTIRYCEAIFFVGDQLEFVENKQASYIKLLHQIKQNFPILYTQIWHQTVLNLQGLGTDKYRLVGDSFDETIMLPKLQETNSGILLFCTYLAKTILAYLFKNYEQAVINSKLAAQYSGSIMGMVIIPFGNFYYSLSLLAMYPLVDIPTKNDYLQQVEENQEKMHTWVQHAPTNYQHKYDLVNAEKARVLGQIGEAMECYDKAIKGAREQKYIQEEAIANELAAEFYFSCGKDKFAQIYLMDAYYGYIQWGATAKVKDLESRYPHIFNSLKKREQTFGDVSKTVISTTTTGVASGVLDLAAVMRASQALAEEIFLDKLLEKLLKIVIQNAGARTSYLILQKEQQLVVEAVGSVVEEQVLTCVSTPVENSKNLPISLINYVARTQENVVLSDASIERRFATDVYITKVKPKSILCMPIINQGELIGILYLENNLTAGVFTPERIEVLMLLSSQMAISLKNALLYANLEVTTEQLKQANNQLEDYSRTLEQKVEDRTLELKEKNVHLKQTLQELKQTQAQLIQTEKMSSLGQLVAGVAHEINNPVNFIYGNLTYAGEYLDDLLNLVEAYQENYPDPKPQVQSELENIDLDFLKEDFPKVLKSMQIGADRIRQIVLSLRNFSRLDEADMKLVNINEGIDSTLLILQHRLAAKDSSFSIEVVKEYGNLPTIECYAGQLNQVFMNILSNAIDALQDYHHKRSLSEGQPSSSVIRINTALIDATQAVIRISDNGCGMSEDVRSKIFDPFFTTKPVGSGTGLGLSISYQIVVDKHGGQLECNSAPGQGAEFVIKIPITQQKLSN